MKLLKQCIQKCFRMEWPLLVRLYDYNHRAGESVSFPMEATRHSSAYDLLYIEWYLHSQIRLSCRLCHWFLVYWSHLPFLWLVSTYTNIRVKSQFGTIIFILIFVSGRFSYHKKMAERIHLWSDDQTYNTKGLAQYVWHSAAQCMSAQYERRDAPIWT